MLGRKSGFEEIEGVLQALTVEMEKGNIGNAEARVPRECYGTSDVDVLLSELYQVPVLTFQHCSNGGGVALTFWRGLEHFEKCEFI